jgi:hypothetical protein
MEMVKQIGNTTEYFIDNELVLAITKCDNDYFIVENELQKLEGECKAVDDYRTSIKIIKNYTKGKNGRVYDSKKTINHNTSWFEYILEEKGFIRKAKVMQ